MVVLWCSEKALSEAGERFYATLGFAAIMLSGPMYLIWITFAFGAGFGKEIDFNSLIDRVLLHTVGFSRS